MVPRFPRTPRPHLARQTSNREVACASAAYSCMLFSCVTRCTHARSVSFMFPLMHSSFLYYACFYRRFGSPTFLCSCSLPHTLFSVPSPSPCHCPHPTHIGCKVSHPRRGHIKCVTPRLSGHKSSASVYCSGATSKHWSSYYAHSLSPAIFPSMAALLCCQSTRHAPRVATTICDAK